MFQMWSAISDGGIYIPDVVGRQILFNLLDLALRVSGREKPYQQAADRASVEVFGVEPPQRVRYRGATRFEDAAKGSSWPRMNLFQVMTKMPHKYFADRDLWIPGEETDWCLSVGESSR